MNLFTEESRNIIEFLETMPSGSRVVLSLPNSYILADAIAYCFNNDLTAVPVDPKLPKYRKEFIIEHSEANALITEEETTQISINKNESPDAFLLIYTSGSTGDPKGVLLSKEAVIENAQEVGKLHGFDKGYAHATCLPLYHCNALCMSLIGSLIFEQKFLLLEKFSVKGYLDLIEENKVKTASIVPALLERIVEEAAPIPECLEYFITAAAPLTSALAKKFFDLYGAKIVQGYGLSESVNFSFVMPKLSEKEFVKEYVEQQPPVGLPLPRSKARIEEGEVLVKSASLMNGYLKNKAASSEVLTSGGYLKTGDTGFFRGEYLVLNGRKKEVINRGGETIYPKDIEENWQEAGLEGEFVALGVKNNILSDEIGLWAGGNAPQEIIKKTEKCFYRPVVVQVGNLLTTSVGKPQRRKMAKGLVSRLLNKELYESVSDRCRNTASIVVNSFDPSKISGRSQFIYNTAKEFLEKAPIYNSSVPMPEAINRSLDIFEENLKDIFLGKKDGEMVMKECRGLWRGIMNGFPMGEYAVLCAEFLRKENRLEGRVLELGAGIGNTSDLIAENVNNYYTRSDLGIDLNPRFSKGQYLTINFNQPLPVDDLDTIFATNAIHCAQNKGITLRNIFNALKKDGLIVIAEGQPTTYKDIPWALSMFYGMFDGWWDIGGFLDRKEWIDLLEEVGFRNIGWSVLRAGHHDLGGLIWAKKES